MILLTQAEADALIVLPKRRELATPYDLKPNGCRLNIPLISHDGREEFVLDIWHRTVELTKATNQLRGRKVIPLLRLDLGGAPHRNPDGAEIRGPHLHRYREGYGDRWATPLPADFGSSADREVLLTEFMRYCCIDPTPHFRYPLW